jgi:hypothetical protein
MKLEMKRGKLQHTLFVWTLVSLGLAGGRVAQATTLVTDAFNDLSQWSVTPASCCVIEDDPTDPVRAKLLRVNYSGANEYIQITRSIDASITQHSNLIFEIEFWDDPAMDYGADFYVMDAQGRYVMFGVNNYYFPQKYLMVSPVTPTGTPAGR